MWVKVTAALKNLFCCWSTPAFADSRQHLHGGPVDLEARQILKQVNTNHLI